MLRRWGPLGVAALLASCSTPPPKPEGPREKLFADSPAQPQEFDPQSYLVGLSHPADCEARARALQPQSTDQAWAVFRACLQGGFLTDLRGSLNLSNGWVPLFTSRPDGLAILTRLIAARGGDIATDVGLAQTAGIQMGADRAKSCCLGRASGAGRSGMLDDFR